MISPAEILADFYALPSPSQVHLNFLRDIGVPIRALHEPDVIKTAKVEFGPRYFDFSEDTAAPGAVLFLLRDMHHDACDVAAWGPRSGRLATYYGRTAMLGEDAVLGPRLAGHGATQTRPAACGTGGRAAHCGGGVGDACRTLRLVCGADPGTAGHWHAHPDRQQQRAGFYL